MEDGPDASKLYSSVQKASRTRKQDENRNDQPEQENELEQPETTNFFSAEDIKVNESTIIATSDEEMDTPSIRRTPRPPVRRRTRGGAPTEPRPKSTPISREEYKNILNKRYSRIHN